MDGENYLFTRTGTAANATRAKSAGQSSGRFFSARSVWWAFAAFFVVLALTGGGSRGDIRSLIILRPLAALFAGYALAAVPFARLREFRSLFILAMIGIAVVGWQLIPLPPEMWQSLPARAPVARLDELLGFGDIWRPASLSPAATWNALFAIIVPVAALLLFSALDPSDRGIVLPAVAIFACVSALWSFGQLLGDPRGMLYLYAVTNTGMPVGLFANRNHNAVFMAAAIPVLAIWGVSRRDGGTRPLIIAAAGCGFLMFSALLSGSRAGALLTVPAVVIGAAVLWQGWQAKAVKTSAPAHRQGRQSGKSGWAIPANARLRIGAAALMAVVITGALFALRGRGLGVDGLLSASNEQEMRVASLPTVLDLLGEVWTTGVGGGSFAVIFQQFEPTHLLSPYYLNQAHNDWLQVAIEYGVAGIALLGLLMLVAARAGIALLRDDRLSLAIRIAALMPLAILAAASLVDYPLRVPSIAAIAIIWLAAIHDPALFAAKTRSRSGHSRFTTGK